MGTCYYLVRPKDQALFDLDKWRPPEAWDTDEFELPPHADLVATIAGDFTRMGYRAGDIDEIARRLIAFAQGSPVVLVNDARDDLDDSRGDDGKLRIVDTRFPGDWSEAKP